MSIATRDQPFLYTLQLMEQLKTSRDFYLRFFFHAHGLRDKEIFFNSDVLSLTSAVFDIFFSIFERRPLFRLVSLTMQTGCKNLQDVSFLEVNPVFTPDFFAIAFDRTNFGIYCLI